MKLLERMRSNLVGRYKQWTFRPHIIKRKVAGEHIQFLVGDLFGEGSYGPHHDPWPELDWVKAHGIRAGDVVIDCGANHGFTTVLFSRWAGPAGRVFAFEPLAHNADILETNLRLNDIGNATCRRAAAGESPGTVRITTHPNGTILNGAVSCQRAIEVPVVRLDDAVDCESVNFLKLDVEGFELEVLKGARRILAGRPRLDLELHVFMYRDKAGHLSELLGLVSLKDYHVEIQTEVDGPIRKFDPNLDSPEALAQSNWVHLFCS